MSELCNILKTMMESVNITVTELARQTGVGQPVIHRMASGETDNPKVGSLSPIAKFFNINISQLIGDDPLSPEMMTGSHNPLYRHWSKVPLLSWEQAIAWPEQFVATEVQSYIATESNVSDKAFAVKVEDNTMFPRYPKGTILIIEPSIELRDKDFALIHVEGENKAQFKQVLLDANDLYLKPLNGDFDIKKIEGQYKTLGIMVQSLTEYYQDRMSSKAIQSDTDQGHVKRRKDRMAEADQI